MITINDLLIQQKVLFKPTGNGNFLISCLSPSHEDKNPSMRVNGSTGACVCFSCGFSANLYTFFGIVDNKINAKAYKVISAIDKLRNREITIPKGAVPFNTSHRGISLSTFKTFGAFNHPVMFIDAICFPLYTYAGKLKAIIARDKESQQSRYRIYPPGAIPPHFPPKPKPANGCVVIVEGIFDVLNAYDKGLYCCVATMGITLCKEQLESLVSDLLISEVNRVVIAYDNDKPGADASRRLADRIKNRFTNVEVFDWEGIESKDFGACTKAQISSISEKLFGFDIT